MPLTEGKMFGVLVVEIAGGLAFLAAYSGLLEGRNDWPYFVPPVFDAQQPDGYFKTREREITLVARSSGKEGAGVEATTSKEMSQDLQLWLFHQYQLLNARGETRDLVDIWQDYHCSPRIRRRFPLPPGGTGDCCAPKLLQYAYSHGLTPIAMGEFWYGASPTREVRRSGAFYPACTGKCGPLLTWMMRGLDVDRNPLDGALASPDEPRVIYTDESIIVADKPSRMLSVPGRTGAPSLLEWLRERYGAGVESCHRLDMDTSGLMVFARSVKVKSSLELQFAERKVRKAYRARLEGGPWNHAAKGTIALPLALDYYDRPRQMVDSLAGKKAITEYELVEVLPDGTLDVLFRPLTGRSHQIRVHAAHIRGLGHPIVGDRLYGTPSTETPLMLRACGIAFTHPATGKLMSFGEGV